MRQNFILILALLGFCLIIIPSVSAHVPLTPEDNHSLEEAFIVYDATKSWALYDHLHEGGEAAYYRFELKAGEKIFAMVYTPEEGAFAPGLVVMGPSIVTKGIPPDYVELANNTGIAVVYGLRPSEAEYEPFTPSSYYYTAEFEQQVDVAGTYYVAVFENHTGGKFGVAIGYVESFTVSEWLGVPIDVIGIHLWEGQSILLIIAPMVIILTVGMILVYLMKKRKGNGPWLLSHWLAIFAGFTFFGSSAMILMQMTIALGRAPGGNLLWVTLVFAAIPQILGTGVILNSVLKLDRVGTRERTVMVVLGIIGLTFWSGLYFGPTLLVLAALLPMKLQGKKELETEKKEALKSEEENNTEEENVASEQKEETGSKDSASV